jgi:hypothetical protein
MREIYCRERIYHLESEIMFNSYFEVDIDFCTLLLHKKYTHYKSVINKTIMNCYQQRQTKSSISFIGTIC